MLKNNLIALVAIVALFTSCAKEYDSIEVTDEKAIQEYLKSHPGFLPLSSGAYYKINEQGTGSSVKYSDSVYYSYNFKSFGGTLFQTTNELNIPSTFLGYTGQFGIGGVAYNFVQMREVLAKLNRGGKATLILPSKLAFGKNGLASSNIGSNENLVIDLGLYSFSKRHEADVYETSKFLAANSSLNFTLDPSGVRYIVQTPGTGATMIDANSTLVANYSAKYLDGVILDQGTSTTLVLRNMIQAWRTILPGKLTTGGKIRMIVPSNMAYGTGVLDFEIEIVSFTND